MLKHHHGLHLCCDYTLNRAGTSVIVWYIICTMKFYLATNSIGFIRSTARMLLRLQLQVHMFHVHDLAPDCDKWIASALELPCTAINVIVRYIFLCCACEWPRHDRSAIQCHPKPQTWVSKYPQFDSLLRTSSGEQQDTKIFASVTDDFPSWKNSNAESTSLPWRHHERVCCFHGIGRTWDTSQSFASRAVPLILSLVFLSQRLYIFVDDATLFKRDGITYHSVGAGLREEHSWAELVWFLTHCSLRDLDEIL